MNRRIIRITLKGLISVLTYILSMHAIANPSNLAEQQRVLFLKAEAALQDQDLPRFKELKEQLIHYPLYPYLQFSELTQQIQNVPQEEFHRFTETYKDSPLAEQLRERWLYLKAKKNDWPAYLHAYKGSEDPGLQCHHLWAKYQVEKNPAVLKEAYTLWLHGQNRPKACDMLFNAWQKHHMTSPMVWQRIKLAIQEDNGELARHLSFYLEKPDQRLVELWLSIHKNPHLIMRSRYFESNHPAILEILVHGISQLAQKSPDFAISSWNSIVKKHPFTERHWGLAVRAIGLAFAQQRNPEAEKWLDKVPAIYANQAVHEWRVRIAILKEDWENVIQRIKALPPEFAKLDCWQYWHARALDKIGNARESQVLLAKLSSSKNYYGFLANERLLKPYALSHIKAQITPSHLQHIKKKPAILRAEELHQLSRVNQARQEWQFAVLHMTDLERQSAAKLALQWHLPQWAILALAKTKHTDNPLELKFPTFYSEHIFSAAHKNQIEPAWIFAITRQESSFVPHAKSPAGALGLMQLRPSTAQMVAKKIKRKLHIPDLFKADTNVHLGSHYLRMIFDKYNKNAVLATTAYNAGIGRVQKWLPDNDMPADAWIETIAFRETRDYVKNVLASTVIYQHLLGKKSKLSHHMPIIPGIGFAEITLSQR